MDPLLKLSLIRLSMTSEDPLIGYLTANQEFIDTLSELQLPDRPRDSNSFLRMKETDFIQLASRLGVAAPDISDAVVIVLRHSLEELAADNNDPFTLIDEVMDFCTDFIEHFSEEVAGSIIYKAIYDPANDITEMISLTRAPIINHPQAEDIRARIRETARECLSKLSKMSPRLQS